MKGFDKFLKRIFGTKIGATLLVIASSIAIFVFTGCFGCDCFGCDCSDCFSCSGDDCAGIADCFRGMGCDACVDCFSCLGCGGCSESSNKTISFYFSIDGHNYGSDMITVSVNKKYKKGDSVSISVPSAFRDYFELKGYYYGDKLVVDKTGKIVDPDTFNKIAGLSARGTERMAGEVVTVYFNTTDFNDELIMNPVQVVVGDVISYFNIDKIRSYCEEKGISFSSSFIGFKVYGTTNRFNVSEGETRFHFYDIGTSANTTLTLVPVIYGVNN